MFLFVTQLACMPIGLQAVPALAPDGIDTAHADAGAEAAPVADVPDRGDECGTLAVSWTPAEAGARQQLLGELVDAGGEEVVVWSLIDAGTGRDTLHGEWSACGLSWRGTGATDTDGDGRDDAWSAEVRGEACEILGEVQCSVDHEPFPASWEYRGAEGCSTWCAWPLEGA